MKTHTHTHVDQSSNFRIVFKIQFKHIKKLKLISDNVGTAQQ